MSENNPTDTDVAIAAINNSISVINSVASRVSNIVYDSTTNKTKVYGHTNFEELNVLGSPVALQSHLTTKADVSHTHDIDDVILTYEEEEDIINGSSNAFQGLQSFANCFSRLRNSLQGYQQVATVAANPLSGAVVL